MNITFSWSLLFALLAVILFIADAIGVSTRVNLVSLGFASTVLAFYLA